MVTATVFATWFGSETVLGIPATFLKEGLRQGEFAVRLEAVGRRPFEVTVTIRKWTGMPYKDAQIVYDTAPSTVAARLTAQDAEALAAALRHVGATASVRGESGEPQA